MMQSYKATIHPVPMAECDEQSQRLTARKLWALKKPQQKNAPAAAGEVYHQGH